VISYPIVEEEGLHTTVGRHGNRAISHWVNYVN
jgi:hypothetical protein